MKLVNNDFGKQIVSKLGSIDFEFSDDLFTLRTYSKDLQPRNLLEARQNTIEAQEPSIDLVIWPKSNKALQRLIVLSNELNFEIYPYGAGSGVCGGAVPAERKREKKRIVVDLKCFEEIEWIDEISQTAKIQCGIIGQVLEERLNAKGYTLGHFPSSIYCSTFGGYLATRAAGQLSTYYGKIEDLVLSLEGVLLTGELFQTPVAPRIAMGPDWNHFFIGSEGTFAFLTSAVVKIHALPKERIFMAFQAPSTEKALEGVRHWMQEGLRPAVVRIYDEEESRMLHGLKSGVLMITVAEGSSAFSEFTQARMLEIIEEKNLGWLELGTEKAEDWWSNRYKVSYRQQQILSHSRLILDTFEISAPFSKLPELHKAVKQIVESFKSQEFLVLLAHFSHFYHTGGNIYFTLCGRSSENFDTIQFYDQVWEKLMQTVVSHGGALSHHHGIGRLKAKYLQEQTGPLHGVLKKIKHELDPKHLFNPENLGL